MRIAEFNEIGIGTMVFYKKSRLKVIDMDRASHRARLSSGNKASGGQWVRCSEFDLHEKEKEVKPKVKEKKGKEPAYAAISVRKANKLQFPTLQECADHFKITRYYVKKAIEEGTSVDGYIIYNINESKMEIKDYEIRIQECRNRLMKAMQDGEIRTVTHFQKEIEVLTEKVMEMKRDKQKLEELFGSDKNFVGMMGKTLSLLLNEADMAIYHLDIYFAALKSYGLEDHAKEWTRARNQLRNSLRDFAQIPRWMMRGESRIKNLEAVCEFSNLVLDGYYTEEEKKYYDKYEEMAGNNY